MTIQEKKAYLRKYLESDREIDRLQEELIRCRSIATKITPIVTNAPGGHGGNRLQSAVEKISELENQIAGEIEKWRKLRDEIITAISKIDDYQLRTILAKRYLRGDKWEQIAVDMQYDYRWILRKHNKALQQLTIESHY